MTDHYPDLQTIADRLRVQMREAALANPPGMMNCFSQARQ